MIRKENVLNKKGAASKATRKHEVSPEAEAGGSGEPKGKRQAISFTGANLEKWRMESGLTHIEAAENFGLPIAKWYSLVRAENAKKPLDDHILAMMRCLYTRYPRAAPNQGRPDLPVFYEFLGFTDTPTDKNEFARLIGRQPPSVYRLLSQQGKPSRSLTRYIEGLQRLGLDGRGTRRVMNEIAAMVYPPPTKPST